MDYQKIYNNLIERSKYRSIASYTEKHHIIPRCLGGSNAKENIAVLTVKEHRVAHACLHLIYPNHQGLALAYVKMYYGNRWQYRDKSTPLRLYEEARKMASNAAKQKRLGKTYEEIMGVEKATKKKANHSAKMSNHAWSNERNKNLRKPKCAGFGEKVSKSLKGRVFKDSTLAKMRLRAKPIGQYDLIGNLIKIWPSIREAAKALKFSAGNMAKVCKDSNKTLKGYRWRYQN